MCVTDGSLGTECDSMLNIQHTCAFKFTSTVQQIFAAIIRLNKLFGCTTTGPKRLGWSVGQKFNVKVVTWCLGFNKHLYMVLQQHESMYKCTKLFFFFLQF